MKSKHKTYGPGYVAQRATGLPSRSRSGVAAVAVQQLGSSRSFPATTCFDRDSQSRVHAWEPLDGTHALSAPEVGNPVTPVSMRYSIKDVVGLAVQVVTESTAVLFDTRSAGDGAARRNRP